MNYGIYETIRNAVSLVLTKLFHSPARLLRYPVFIRNKKNIKISEGLTTGYNCRIEAFNNGQIVFGKNDRLGDYVHIASGEKVVIGDDVLMASHIFITDLEHGNYSGENQSDPQTKVNDRTLSTKPVIIGNNVWLGESVKVLKGVTIGDNSIIGANALVVSDIPANCIAVGSPAKVIKKYDSDKKQWVKVD